MIPDAIARHIPWTDRSGRFSPARAAVFAALCVPALILLGRWGASDLGPRPITEAIHVSGDWAARLLVLTIAITPLRHLSGRSQLIGYRRMIGVSVAAYAALHLALYALDLDFEVGRIVTEILVRPYLTLGFVAFVGLLALAVTSTDGMIRRLGGAAWKRLHDLVHPITILVLIHLFLQSKLDLAQGAILTGIAFGGLALRLVVDHRARLGWPAVAVATVAALVFGATGEAVWFLAKTGRAVGPLIAANFAFEARISPAWVAAGITLCVAAAAVLARKRKPAGRRA